MKASHIALVFIALAAMSAAVFLYLQHEKPVQMAESSRFLMGTVVQIKIPIVSGQDAGAAGKAAGKAFDEIGRVEKVFSAFKVDSAISDINRNAFDHPVKVTPEVLSLIRRSVKYSRKTRGAFDITVKPLVDLWRHAEDARKLPSEEKIKEALKNTGSGHIIIDSNNNTIRFTKSGMGIDMGGVAKGYAVDRAVKMLKDNGIRNAVVDSGGDLYCLGMRSQRTPWKVGIRHPRDKKEILLDIMITDGAVDTSGDYEKYFMFNGRRFSHIIDPRTGYPVGDRTVSATVIAPDSTTADILATALCVLGEEGLKVVESIDSSSAISVYNEKGVLRLKRSEGMKKYEENKKR